MKNAPGELDERLTLWMEYHQELIGRWKQMCTEIKATKSPEFAVYSVALRELWIWLKQQPMQRQVFRSSSSSRSR